MRSKPRRVDIEPGRLLVVRTNRTLELDPHLILSGRTRTVPDHTSLIVISRPRKQDGINLVRVRINEIDEFECYYCDVVNNCDLA
jgi:hypothetical protein